MCAFNVFSLRPILFVHWCLPLGLYDMTVKLRESLGLENSSLFTSLCCAMCHNLNVYTFKRVHLWRRPACPFRNSFPAWRLASVRSAITKNRYFTSIRWRQQSVEIRSSASAEIARHASRWTEGRIRLVPNAISGTSGSRRPPQMTPFDSPNAISY